MKGAPLIFGTHHISSKHTGGGTGYQALSALCKSLIGSCQSIIQGSVEAIEGYALRVKIASMAIACMVYLRIRTLTCSALEEREESQQDQET